MKLLGRYWKGGARPVGSWTIALWALACQPANSPERVPAAASASSEAISSASPAPARSTPVTPGPPPAPVASATPNADGGAADAGERTPPPPPPPPLETCTGTFPDPRCWDHFPSQVRCPPQLADVPVGGYCGLEGKTQAPAACRYAETTCKCKHLEYCGGVTPTQLQQMGMTWVCAPTPGPGDCPEAASPGQRCTKPGQSCDYGGCGSATHCSCLAANAARPHKEPYFSCQTSMRSSPP